MPQKDFYQISLKLILKNDKGEILILNGHPQGSFAGFYDLPGGRVDENEFNIPFAEIIKREVNEELGDVKISVDPKPAAIGRHLIPARLTTAGKELHILYVFFEAKLIGGEIKISSEHDGYKWVDPEKIDPKEYFISGLLEGINMYLSGK